MSSQRTDNSKFYEKVKMRLALSEDGTRVLDCYHGNGDIWEYIKKRKKVDVLGIEKEKGKGVNNLYGDCLKIIPCLDLKKFDIIDVDCWGFPDKALLLIFNGKPKRGTIVFYTLIQSGMKRCPDYLLKNIGITKKMINLCSTIFSHLAFDAFKNMLYKNNIKEIYDLAYMEKSIKHYGYFIIA